jgi:hypothetical protein
MKFVPVHCETCVRSDLVRASDVLDGALCGECGSAMRTLPGQTYGSQDVALFKDLEQTLREAQLTPLNAVPLSVELEAFDHHPDRAIKRVAQLLPSLAILELVVSNDATTMRKAKGMLATLLDVIAASRSQSTMVPARRLRPAKSGGGLV